MTASPLPDPAPAASTAAAATEAEAAAPPRKLGRLAHEPLGPGVGLDEVDFDVSGERVAPFHMATFWVEPGAVSEVDLHDVRETWYVLAGSATLIGNDGERPVSAGDVVFLESRTPHQLDNRSDERLEVLALWW